MDELHNLLLERANRAFKHTTITAAWNSRRGIVGPANMPNGELAAEVALFMLRQGQEPSPKQLEALELAIRLMRPAPLSKQGNLEDLPPEASRAFEHWGYFRSLIQPFLYSIGRIDKAPDTAIGTGFIVGSGLLVTNKHVLDLLSAGTQVLEKTQAVVRFKHEYGSLDEAAIPIVGVRAVHPSLDIALLEIEKSELIEDRPPLLIDPTGVPRGHPVVAVGYPANDPVRNPLFISAIFGNAFGVKRAAPGEITGIVSQSIFHDCSTLGGNSGSPLLSMKSACVVGMHRDGFFMYRNEAVDGASLSEFVKKT